VATVILGDDPQLSMNKLFDLEIMVMTSGGCERTVEEFSALFAAARLKLVRAISTA
jgi:hypothetical protein